MTQIFLWRKEDSTERCNVVAVLVYPVRRVHAAVDSGGPDIENESKDAFGFSNTRKDNAPQVDQTGECPKESRVVAPLPQNEWWRCLVSAIPPSLQATSPRDTNRNRTGPRSSRKPPHLSGELQAALEEEASDVDSLHTR